MALIIFLVGIILFFFSYRSFKKTKKLLATGQTTTGTVISIKEVENTDDEFSSSSRSYYPILEFNDINQNKHTFQSKLGHSNKRKWQIGQKVSVVYNPDNPKEARIKSFFQLWFGTLILSLLTTISIILAIMNVLAN